MDPVTQPPTKFQKISSERFVAFRCKVCVVNLNSLASKLWKEIEMTDRQVGDNTFHLYKQNFRVMKNLTLYLFRLKRIKTKHYFEKSLTINIYKTLMSIPSWRRKGGVEKTNTLKMVKYDKKVWYKKGGSLTLPKIRRCFVAFFITKKNGVDGYVIARKVSFYTIFILHPKFTLIYTLFSMVTRK